MDLSRIGPHRIDVQQGNALDQESVAKLKPGLNRSQVRFLLGTPLVVDPFREDRWDYVYTFYKGGKLADQKHITLFFKDDILDRIEGDVPVGEALVAPADTPAPSLTPMPPDTSAPSAVESSPLALSPKSAPVTETSPTPSATTDAAPARSGSAAPDPSSITSIVPPLPSPKGVPAYVDPGAATGASLKPETDVARIQQDVVPEIPDTQPVPVNPATPDNAAILQALKTWSEAWKNRDEEAYIAAYAPEFVPQGGGSHADWEKRRRLLLGLARNIDLTIESPSIVMEANGRAQVTLKQYYRSDNYRDAVVKTIGLEQRDGKWLIVDERVISIIRPRKP